MEWAPPPVDGIEVPQWMCLQPLDRKERPANPPNGRRAGLNPVARRVVNSDAAAAL